MRAPLWKSFALHLALAAILLRGLVPNGWMPGTQGNDHPGVVLCTMDGLRHDAPTNHKPITAACPFAVAAQLASPVAVSQLPGPSMFVWQTGKPVQQATSFASAGYRPNAARAPPPRA
jgi:hypothetical protein